MVYLIAGKDGHIQHKSISGAELLGIDPLSEHAYYNFEAGFPDFEQFYTGDREKIDLVMLDRAQRKALCGLEIKLTALPDSTTKAGSDEEYSCEIVVRPPTICFLACSICQHYSTTPSAKAKLQSLLSAGIPQINHWEEADEVAPHYDQIERAILSVAADMRTKQTPLIIQPIWKTEGGKMRLAEDCLDVFVWSNLATIRMFTRQDKTKREAISRFQRATIWLYRMLFDFSIYGQFDYIRIIKNHSFGTANDKAFALGGTASHQFLTCPELTHPRIKKHEIRNIILGGDQNLLSPERRFDAVLVNSPDLFD